MSIAAEYFTQALDAYNRGDLATAASAFQNVLALDPRATEAMLNLGSISFRQQQWEAAEQYWRRAIEANPLEEKAYLNLGNLYFNQQAYSKAIYYWQIFRSLNPTHVNICLNLGLAHEALEQIPKAHSYFKIFLRLKGDDLEGHRLRRKLDEAKRVAEHNLKLAEKYMHSGELQKAQQAFELCIGLVPLNPRLYQHYASVLYQLKSFEKAAQWYELAYEGMDTDTGLLVNLGVTYEKLDKLFLAMWAYYTAITMNPMGISGKVKIRFQTLWTEHGDMLIEKTFEQVNTLINTMDYAAAEQLITRLYDIAFSKAPDKVVAIKKMMDFLENARHPKMQMAVMAYCMAEQHKANGEYYQALSLYKQYLELQPDGDKVPEIRASLGELEERLKEEQTPLLGNPIHAA